MILVVGASSVLGTRIVARLVASGATVRAASRDPAGLCVPPVAGTVALDVRNPDTFAPALRDVAAVVCAVHGLAPPRRDNHPGIVDGVGVGRLIAAAASAGVSHFVLMSAKGAAPDAPARFFQLKHLAEERLRESGMQWTIVRPPAFMEVHALRLMGEPLLAGKPVALVGGGEVPIDWVSADDVAAEVVRRLDEEEHDATLELSGPELHSRAEALAILEGATGTTAKRRNVPITVAGALRRIGGVFNPGIGYLVETALAEFRPPGDSTPADCLIAGATTLGEVVTQWAAEHGHSDLGSNGA